MRPLLILLLLVIHAGCSSAPPDEVLTWRVRGTDSVDLNDDTGWAAAAGAAATVRVDRPFRIRFAVDHRAGAPASYRLEARRNEGAWIPLEALGHPYPDGIASAVTSIVSSEEYAHGEATTGLLGGGGFVGGAGVSLREETRLREWAAGITEWEWPLVIRYFSDGALRIDNGDTFDYRLVTRDGNVLPGAAPARVTVSVPEGHLGGTFVETPGRIGPFEASNGDLYFVQEPSETDNVFMMVKSEDEGRTWAEVDGANRPPNGDLESVSAVLLDNVVHMIHQGDSVWYYSFNTSDHPTAPDRWAERNEFLSGPLDPATQSVALAAGPGETLLAFYSGDRSLLWRQRSAEGTWGPEEEIVPHGSGAGSEEGSEAILGPVAEADGAGTIHLAYVDLGGRAWHRTLPVGGQLSGPTLLSSSLDPAEERRLGLLPIVALESGGVSILFRQSDGLLVERRWTNGSLGGPVVVADVGVAVGPVDSDQTTADAVSVGDDVHVLFVEAESGSLWHTVRPGGSIGGSGGAGGAGWSTPELVMGGIEGQWIRGAVLRAGQQGPVYGYVVDAGSDGGSGFNQFGTLPVR